MKSALAFITFARKTDQKEMDFRGVLFVERGSARVPCVCSPSFSLSVPIELKLVIAYRSCRSASGLYSILSRIDFNHFF